MRARGRSLGVAIEAAGAGLRDIDDAVAIDRDAFASSTAREKRRSASCGIGRCIPGMLTKPPSGTAPMPYSMPLRDRLRIAGGNPM